MRIWQTNAQHSAALREMNQILLPRWNVGAGAVTFGGPIVGVKMQMDDGFTLREMLIIICRIWICRD